MKSFDFLFNLFFRDHDHNIIDVILALIRGEEVQMDGWTFLTFLLWIITIVTIIFYAVRDIIKRKSAKSKGKNRKK